MKQNEGGKRGRESGKKPNKVNTTSRKFTIEKRSA